MEAFKLFFQQVTPFAIVLVLVALALVFFHVVKVLIQLRHSIEDINSKLVELDEPVKTVVKLSSTMNSIHDKGGKAVSGVISGASSNVSALRSLLKMTKRKKKSN